MSGDDGDMCRWNIGWVLAAAGGDEWRRMLRLDHCRMRICETRAVMDLMWRGASVRFYVGISILVLKSFAPKAVALSEKYYHWKSMRNDFMCICRLKYANCPNMHTRILKCILGLPGPSMHTRT